MTFGVMGTRDRTESTSLQEVDLEKNSQIRSLFISLDQKVCCLMQISKSDFYQAIRHKN